MKFNFCSIVLGVQKVTRDRERDRERQRERARKSERERDKEAERERDGYRERKRGNKNSIFQFIRWGTGIGSSTDL